MESVTAAPTFQRVLAAIDDSALSRAALAVAFGIAKTYGASLVVTSVVNTSAAYVHAEADAADSTGGVILDRAVTEAQALGIATERLLLHGEPLPQLIAAVRDSGADLVVMGTHGRTGVSALYLGSVAQGMVRAVHVPVLVVPAPLPGV